MVYRHILHQQVLGLFWGNFLFLFSVHSATNTIGLCYGDIGDIGLYCHPRYIPASIPASVPSITSEITSEIACQVHLLAYENVLHY
jgi:hypothetical protein